MFLPWGRIEAHCFCTANGRTTNTSFTPMQDDRVYRHLHQFSFFVAFALEELGGFLRTECTLHISSNKFGRVCRRETFHNLRF